MNSKNIENILNRIKKRNISIKKDVEWLLKIVAPIATSVIVILGTVFIFGFNLLNNNINSKFDSIDSKFNILNQKLDSQKT